MFRLTSLFLFNIILRLLYVCRNILSLVNCWL